MVGRVAAARPGVPLVAMAYVNQVLGGPDGRERALALARAGAAGVIVADLTPDEGGRVRGGRERGRHRGHLPRGADHGPRAARADRGTQRRVPVLRVAGGRHGCADVPAADGRSAGPATCEPCRPVPVAVGFGVSRPAHARAIAHAGADGVIVARRSSTRSARTAATWTGCQTWFAACARRPRCAEGERRSSSGRSVVLLVHPMPLRWVGHHPGESARRILSVRWVGYHPGESARRIVSRSRKRVAFPRKAILFVVR